MGETPVKPLKKGQVFLNLSEKVRCEVCANSNDITRVVERLKKYECTWCDATASRAVKLKELKVTSLPSLKVNPVSNRHECQICGFHKNIKMVSVKGYIGRYFLCSSCRIDYE